MSNRKLIASVILNFTLFALTSAVIISYFLGNLTPEVKTPAEKFIFFTTDSNILAAVGALLTAVCNIAVLRGKLSEMPRVISAIKLMGTVSLQLTFFTVLFLLLPVYGFELLFGGTGSHMHAVAPLLSLITFVFLDGHSKLPLRYALYGIIPMLIYAAVYLTQVVFIGFANGGWMDFYTFNRNGAWPVSLAVMFAATLALSFGVIWLHNRFCKK